MQIESLTFRTKTEAKNYFYQYIRNHNAIDDVDIENIKAFISMHPKIIGRNFTPFIDFDKYGRGTRCFWCRFDDGSTDSVSVPNCLNGYNTLQLLNEKMRDLIRNQISSYRLSQIHNENLTCTLCGKVDVAISKNMHVDHEDPQFVTIRNSFIAIEGLTSEEALERIRADIEIQNRWKDYHQSHAKLRILCADCNLHRKRKE